MKSTKTSSTTRTTATTAATNVGGIKQQRGQPPPPRQRQRVSDDYYYYDNDDTTEEPSITFSLFFSWVLPVLLFAICSRYYAVDTTSMPTKIDVAKQQQQQKQRQGPTMKPKPQPQVKNKKKPSSSPSPITINNPKLSQLPTSYQKIIETIRSRRKRFLPAGGKLDIDSSTSTSKKKKATSSATTSSSSSTTTETQQRRTSRTSGRGGGREGDTERTRSLEQIERLRDKHESDPNDLYSALEYADALRMYELQYHQGGTFEKDAIEMYNTVVTMARRARQIQMDKGLSTTSEDGKSVNDEVTLEYKLKSPDALLCSVLTNQGKVYYMANMFEKAVESYNECISISNGEYLDAVNSRGSTLIILGQYKQAAKDFYNVITRDYNRLLFVDAYTGLARVLSASPNVLEPDVQNAWDKMATDMLQPLIEQLGMQYEQQVDAASGQKQLLASTLNRFHHVMFTYHDTKTMDHVKAWEHLSDSYRYKLQTLPKWNTGFESQKVKQTRDVFRSGFWSTEAGSSTKTPIFIIGFVRSGSTLLERVLDAHPQIVGTGENSVFNGRLDEIRNRIVEVSMTGQSPQRLGQVTEELADSVVEEMRRRWKVIDENTEKSTDESDEQDEQIIPQRFVDKMLTNYYNVGFIHLLYPNALILHVAREPMDTLFSAYKHEFPPGTLDYTSDIQPLAELYHAYRDLIEHWDTVLPGRVTHVRYEDMVHDMPTIAKSIINATGLEWDDTVLDFHRKKHAVNTLSTTQVRKGIYKDSLQSWKKYEKELQPLVKLIGERVKYDLKSSLPGYKRTDGAEKTTTEQSSSSFAAATEDDTTSSSSSSMKEPERDDDTSSSKDEL